MKKFKKAILIFSILLLLVIVARNWIYFHVVTYKSLNSRASFPLSNKDLKSYTDIYAANHEFKNIDDLIQEVQQLTTNQLTFSFSKSAIDPNLLITSKRANCIGYANFFTTCFIYMSAKSPNLKDWKASAQRAHLYFFSNNIHAYLNHPFFKDHDFVIIENIKTGELKALDPSLYDYFYIDEVRIKN